MNLNHNHINPQFRDTNGGGGNLLYLLDLLAQLCESNESKLYKNLRYSYESLSQNQFLHLDCHESATQILAMTGRGGFVIRGLLHILRMFAMTIRRRFTRFAYFNPQNPHTTHKGTAMIT